MCHTPQVQMATPQTPVAPVAQPDPQLTQAGNMAVDPESLNPSQQAPQIAQETTVGTWRRWATGPFNTLLWSPAQAEAAMGWAVALHERISSAGVADDVIMQFADRAGLGDWDLGDVLSCLAAYERRTGLAPDLIKGHFVQTATADAAAAAATPAPAQAQQPASQPQAPAPAQHQATAPATAAGA